MRKQVQNESHLKAEVGFKPSPPPFCQSGAPVALQPPKRMTPKLGGQVWGDLKAAPEARGCRDEHGCPGKRLPGFLHNSCVISSRLLSLSGLVGKLGWWNSYHVNTLEY